MRTLATTGNQTITFLGNWPSFKNFCGTLKFWHGNQWEIIECGTSWKRLAAEQMNENLRLVVLETPYERYFSGRVIWVQFEVIRCTLQIPDVKIFKRLLLPQFSSNFNQTLQKACIRGKYRLLLFLSVCHSLKVYGTLNRSYFSSMYIASIDKAMLVSSSKRSSRTLRPLDYGGTVIVTLNYHGL